MNRNRNRNKDLSAAERKLCENIEILLGNMQSTLRILYRHMEYDPMPEELISSYMDDLYRDAQDAERQLKERSSLWPQDDMDRRRAEYHAVTHPKRMSEVDRKISEWSAARRSEARSEAERRASQL